MKVLPVDFENRMKNLLGDEFSSYKASLEDEPVKSFRVNTDKISLEDFIGTFLLFNAVLTESTEIFNL